MNSYTTSRPSEPVSRLSISDSTAEVFFVMDNIGVYQIELNGKRYVGSSAYGIKQRWASHLSALRKGEHQNKHLQNSFNKYGEGKLIFSILEIVETPEQVIIVEQKYIDELKPEYNMRLIADSNFGIKRSEECVQRMREFAMGNKYALGNVMSDEAKQRISNAMKGRRFSEETLKKMSIASLGRKITEEHKTKQREKMIGRKLTEEQKRKIGNASRGHLCSEETKEKLREAMKNYPQEARDKISKAHKGKTYSEEIKKKMGEANKGNKYRVGKKHTEESKKKMSLSAKLLWEKKHNETKNLFV